MVALFQFPKGMDIGMGTGADGVWRYWRPFSSDIVELGVVCGQDVSLPVHFHEEDQLTFVLSGRRRFLMKDSLFDVAPGQGVRIPAGTPHRSLSESMDIFCINIYTSPGVYDAMGLFAGMSLLLRRQGSIDWLDLAAIIKDHRCDGGMPQERTEARNASWETVSEGARLAGMSREGFSRRFRKQFGIPPQIFRLSERLNEARHLLRVGQPVAAVAAETGFSDQSHLGRCFRRAFGVTPGHYRRSVSHAP
ncbi:helix-turn-helix domain-containing protein [Azospirillum sp. Sh1]|uniref:helix-turn-helix domain-containing protein n=1 Tax=Azospirillum sp. Sh1 TaxID=2607285 RepID=UPI0011EC4E51|nr:helix-turn-helix domain-containing protein [Azospirillum sp. Sh1]KAA0569936.1 AraC family transcriptional regulator [Azospirillum sp. Sh1]